MVVQAGRAGGLQQRDRQMGLGSVTCTASVVVPGRGPTNTKLLQSLLRLLQTHSQRLNQSKKPSTWPYSSSFDFPVMDTSQLMIVA